MSDLNAVMFILATHGLLILCTILVYRQVIRGKNQAVTGVVDGLPVTTKHRWNILFFEVIGGANIVIVQHAVFAFGYFKAASVLDDPRVGSVAELCGWAALFGLTATLVPVIALAFDIASVLRQSKRD
jgi:hypothetical protein